MSDEYTYLQINNGRYLCATHGGFCCEKDNYLRVCPICEDTAAINEPARILAIINGLQERSKRNFTLISTMMGGLGALMTFSEKTPASIWLWLSIALLLASVSFYSLSMKHIAVAAEIPKEKTSAEWIIYFREELHKLEEHAAGGQWALIFGIVVFGFTLVGIL